MRIRIGHVRKFWKVGCLDDYPVPKKPSQSERDALLEAGRRMREEMERLGITEDELVAGFKKWRKKDHAA